jgi:hypothetical protein
VFTSHYAPTAARKIAAKNDDTHISSDFLQDLKAIAILAYRGGVKTISMPLYSLAQATFRSFLVYALPE